MQDSFREIEREDFLAFDSVSLTVLYILHAATSFLTLCQWKQIQERYPLG